MQPSSAKGIITQELNKVFQQIVGTSMAAKQKEVDAKCKASSGVGAGTKDIGSLELS